MINKYINFIKYQANSRQSSVWFRVSATSAKLAGLMLLPSVFIAPAQAASAVKSGQRVLMVEMTPALCNLQPTRARMRQCLEGSGSYESTSIPQ